MDRLKTIGLTLIGVNLALLPFSPVPKISGTAISLLGAVSLLYLFKTRNFKPKLTDAGVLLWVSAILISCLFSINPRMSFHYFDKLILKPLLLYMGIRVFTTRQDLKELCAILGITYSAYGIAGVIYGDFSERFRAFSPYPTILGKMLDLMIPVVASILIASRNIVVRVTCALGLTALITALIASMTRGAWIATGTALSVLFAYLFFKGRYKKHLILFVAIASLASFVLMPGYQKVILKKRLVSILHLKEEIEKDPSLAGRVRFYKTAIHLIKEKPLLGWGFGRKVVKCINRKLSLAWFEKRGLSLITHHTHDIYLQILLETGIVGLFGFAVFMLSFFYESLKIIKEEKEKLLPLGLTLSVLAVLIHALVTNILQAPVIYMLFAHTALVLACNKSP